MFAKKNSDLNFLFCSVFIVLSVTLSEANSQQKAKENNTNYPPLVIELSEQSLNKLTEKTSLELWQTPAVIAIGAVVVAVIGIVGGRMSVSWQLKANRKILSEELKLRYINDKLNMFYGPMLALTEASNELWKQFAKERGRSAESFFKKDKDDIKVDPKTEDLEEWKRVMKEAFLPINQQREKLVLEHAALITRSSDGTLPNHLIRMVAHISEFRSVMSKWNTHRSPADALAIYRDKGEGEFQPTVKFPAEDITAYARREYEKLKKDQSDLYMSLDGKVKRCGKKSDQTQLATPGKSA